jgi:hypothetical protein
MSRSILIVPSHNYVANTDAPISTHAQKKWQILQRTVQVIAAVGAFHSNLIQYKLP